VAKINKKGLVIVQPITLNSILSTGTPGFVRLDVTMGDVRTAESKHGKLRFAVLVQRSSNSRLHQCYLAAVIMMFRKYRLGESPLVDCFQEPAELKHKYQAVYNHVKPLPPSVVLRNLEFIHTQAEALFRVYSKRDGYWNYYNIDNSRPL
jgi:hypothetical protein